MLIQMAVKMNVADAIPSLRQNLNEEEEMCGWLRANAPTIYIYKSVARIEFLLNHLKNNTNYL